jgi:hypothetical protein
MERKFKIKGLRLNIKKPPKIEVAKTVYIRKQKHKKENLMLVDDAKNI